MKTLLRLICALGLALALNGCASMGSNPQDPLEGFNRTMFSFNDTVDKAALRPTAELYRSVLPSFVQTAIGNFFGNIGDVWTAVNNFLQGKPIDGGSDILRVAINSVFGFAGILDIASDAGLIKHKEDFGQTLGAWGITPGPYIVLPFFGSSTLRDVVAMPLDLRADPVTNHTPVTARNVGISLRAIDQRSLLLGASNLLEEAALDPYEFTRDAFLQRRESKVYDDEYAMVPRKQKD